MNYLLHPELFSLIPVVGESTAAALTQQVNEVANTHTGNDPNISVVVRALNEAERLEKLFKDINEQIFAGEVQVILVDNDSTDGTASVARSFGAEVVRLSREKFTYPRSINAGLEAASYDAVYLTVAHAALTNKFVFWGGARHFEDPSVGGVFARTLPNDNATLPERLIAMGNRAFIKPPRLTRKATLGVMASQNAFVSRSIWEELGGFDERYEIGGEDTALAGEMIESGYKVIEDPVVGVHHTHGLGLVNTARQWRAWMAMASGPHRLNMEELTKRRPDLNFD